MNINITVHVDGARRRRPQLRWEIGPVSEQPTLGAIPRRRKIMQKLTDSQQTQLAVTVKNRRGNVAEVQNPKWSSSDPTVCTVTPDEADPNKALLKAVAAGTAQVNWEGDGDLGDGVRLLHATLDVTVVPGEAIVAAINTGTPEEQP